MDQESVVTGMKTANKELFTPHISILKHLWMSTVMSMMTQLHKHFIWESYWVRRWMCINFIPCDVSGAHAVLHPPLIKIFWSVAVQKFLGRLSRCLISTVPQWLVRCPWPGHSPNLYFTDGTAHNKNDLPLGRVHFWFRKRASKANKLGGIHQHGGLRVERWRKSEASLWRAKQGYYNIPLWWTHALHFAFFFFFKSRNRYCIKERCKHSSLTGVYAD